MAMFITAILGIDFSDTEYKLHLKNSCYVITKPFTVSNADVKLIHVMISIPEDDLLSGKCKVVVLKEYQVIYNGDGMVSENFLSKQ